MNLLHEFVSKNRMMSRVLERKYPSFYASEPYRDELLGRILSSVTSGDDYSILEVGGIDRPLLKKDSGFTYDGLDIESRERCYDIYDHFIVQSIEDNIKKKYDCIISSTLLEHVPNNAEGFHSIFNALNASGATHHYLPSKWHPYAMALRMIGPKLQQRLIPILRPHAVEVTGYPAYFNHCSPVGMRKLLRERGFTQIDIKAYFRANDYFAFFVPLFVIVSAFENLCKKMGWEIFASGFVMSAKKPEC